MASLEKSECGSLVFQKPGTAKPRFPLLCGETIRIGCKDGDDIRINSTDRKTYAVLNIAKDTGFVQVSNPDGAETMLNNEPLTKSQYLIPGDMLHIKGKTFVYISEMFTEQDIVSLKAKNTVTVREVPKARYSASSHAAFTKAEQDEQVDQQTETPVTVRKGFTFQTGYVTNITPSRTNSPLRKPRISEIPKTANSALEKKKSKLLRRRSLDLTLKALASPFVSRRLSTADIPDSRPGKDLMSWNTLPPVQTPAKKNTSLRSSAILRSAMRAHQKNYENDEEIDVREIPVLILSNDSSCGRKRSFVIMKNQVAVSAAANLESSHRQSEEGNDAVETELLEGIEEDVVPNTPAVVLLPNTTATKKSFSARTLNMVQLSSRSNLENTPVIQSLENRASENGKSRRSSQLFKNSNVGLRAEKRRVERQSLGMPYSIPKLADRRRSVATLPNSRVLFQTGRGKEVLRTSLVFSRGNSNANNNYTDDEEQEIGEKAFSNNTSSGAKGVRKSTKLSENVPEDDEEAEEHLSLQTIGSKSGNLTRLTRTSFKLKDQTNLSEIIPDEDYSPVSKEQSVTSELGLGRSSRSFLLRDSTNIDKNMEQQTLGFERLTDKIKGDKVSELSNVTTLRKSTRLTGYANLKDRSSSTEVTTDENYSDFNNSLRENDSASRIGKHTPRKYIIPNISLSRSNRLSAVQDLTNVDDSGQTLNFDRSSNAVHEQNVSSNKITLPAMSKFRKSARFIGDHSHSSEVMQDEVQLQSSIESSLCFDNVNEEYENRSVAMLSEHKSTSKKKSIVPKRSLSVSAVPYTSQDIINVDNNVSANKITSPAMSKFRKSARFMRDQSHSREIMPDEVQLQSSIESSSSFDNVNEEYKGRSVAMLSERKSTSKKKSFVPKRSLSVSAVSYTSQDIINVDNNVSENKITSPAISEFRKSARFMRDQSHSREVMPDEVQLQSSIESSSSFDNVNEECKDRSVAMLSERKSTSKKKSIVPKRTSSVSTASYTVQDITNDDNNVSTNKITSPAMSKFRKSAMFMGDESHSSKVMPDEVQLQSSIESSSCFDDVNKEYKNGSIAMLSERKSTPKKKSIVPKRSLSVSAVSYTSQDITNVDNNVSTNKITSPAMSKFRKSARFIRSENLGDQTNLSEVMPDEGQLQSSIESSSCFDNINKEYEDARGAMLSERKSTSKKKSTVLKKSLSSASYIAQDTTNVNNNITGVEVLQSDSILNKTNNQISANKMFDTSKSRTSSKMSEDVVDIESRISSFNISKSRWSSRITASDSLKDQTDLHEVRPNENELQSSVESRRLDFQNSLQDTDNKDQNESNATLHITRPSVLESQGMDVDEDVMEEQISESDSTFDKSVSESFDNNPLIRIGDSRSTLHSTGKKVPGKSFPGSSRSLRLIRDQCTPSNKEVSKGSAISKPHISSIISIDDSNLRDVDDASFQKSSERRPLKQGKSHITIEDSRSPFDEIRNSNDKTGTKHSSIKITDYTRRSGKLQKSATNDNLFLDKHTSLRDEFKVGQQTKMLTSTVQKGRRKTDMIFNQPMLTPIRGSVKRKASESRFALLNVLDCRKSAVLEGISTCGTGDEVGSAFPRKLSVDLFYANSGVLGQDESIGGSRQNVGVPTVSSGSPLTRPSSMSALSDPIYGKYSTLSGSPVLTRSNRNSKSAVDALDTSKDQSLANSFSPEYEDVTVDDEVLSDVDVEVGDHPESELEVSGIEKMEASPKADLTSASNFSARRVSAITPKVHGVKLFSNKNPLNDLTNVEGVHEVFTVHTPLNELTDRGLKQLFDNKSPHNDLTNAEGVQRVFKRQNTSANDLRDVVGVKRTMRSNTPRNSLSNVGVKCSFDANTPKSDLSDVEGVKNLFKRQNTPKNDSRNVEGVKRIITRNTPRNDLSNVTGVKCASDVHTLENDFSDVEGVENLFKRQNTSKNDLSDVEGEENLFKRRNTPKNVLRDVEGIRSIMTRNTPRNDLSNVSGVKCASDVHIRKNDLSDVEGVENLFKRQNTPKNDLRDVEGVKRIMTRNSPRNDLSNVTGVKHAFHAHISKNDLSDVEGVKTLFKRQNTPKNDLSDVHGVQGLFKRHNTPENDLRNVEGVKQIMMKNAPRNSLSNVAGVKRIFDANTPKNDLSDVRGVKDLFKRHNTPKDDLRDVAGVRNIFKRQNTPKNDLADVCPIKRLFATEKTYTTPVLNQVDIFRTPKARQGNKSETSGTDDLFEQNELVEIVPKGTSSTDDFDILTGRQSYKTYLPKSFLESPEGKPKVVNDSITETLESIKKKRKMSRSLRAKMKDGTENFFLESLNLFQMKPFNVSQTSTPILRNSARKQKRPVVRDVSKVENVNKTVEEDDIENQSAILKDQPETKKSTESKRGISKEISDSEQASDKSARKLRRGQRNMKNGGNRNDEVTSQGANSEAEMNSKSQNIQDKRTRSRNKGKRTTETSKPKEVSQEVKIGGEKMDILKNHETSTETKSKKNTQTVEVEEKTRARKGTTKTNEPILRRNRKNVRLEGHEAETDKSKESKESGNLNTDQSSSTKGKRNLKPILDNIEGQREATKSMHMQKGSRRGRGKSKLDEENLLVVEETSHRADHDSLVQQETHSAMENTENDLKMPKESLQKVVMKTRSRRGVKIEDIKVRDLVQDSPVQQRPQSRRGAKNINTKEEEGVKVSDSLLRENLRNPAAKQNTRSHQDVKETQSAEQERTVTEGGLEEAVPRTRSRRGAKQTKEVQEKERRTKESDENLESSSTQQKTRSRRGAKNSKNTEEKENVGVLEEDLGELQLKTDSHGGNKKKGNAEADKTENLNENQKAVEATLQDSTTKTRSHRGIKKTENAQEKENKLMVSDEDTPVQPKGGPRRGGRRLKNLEDKHNEAPHHDTKNAKTVLNEHNLNGQESIVEQRTRSRRDTKKTGNRGEEDLKASEETLQDRVAKTRSRSGTKKTDNEQEQGKAVGMNDARSRRVITKVTAEEEEKDMKLLENRPQEPIEQKPRSRRGAKKTNDVEGKGNLKVTEAVEEQGQTKNVQKVTEHNLEVVANTRSRRGAKKTAITEDKAPKENLQEAVEEEGSTKEEPKVSEQTLEEAVAKTRTRRGAKKTAITEDKAPEKNIQEPVEEQGPTKEEPKVTKQNLEESVLKTRSRRGVKKTGNTEGKDDLEAPEGEPVEEQRTRSRRGVKMVDTTEETEPLAPKRSKRKLRDEKQVPMTNVTSSTTQADLVYDEVNINNKTEESVSKRTRKQANSDESDLEGRQIKRTRRQLKMMENVSLDGDIKETAQRPRRKAARK